MSSNIRVQRICQFCCNEFTAKTTVTKFCSLRCASRYYKKRTRDLKIQANDKATAEIKAKPITEIKEKEFLSIANVCKLIGISRQTFYRLVKRKQIRVAKIGRRVIVRKIEIDKLFQK